MVWALRLRPRMSHLPLTCFLPLMPPSLSPLPNCPQPNPSVLRAHALLGQWWECLGYGDADERTPLPPLCTDAHIQAGPGEFGFYPLLDRSGGGGAAGPTRQPYYMAVVLAEPDSLSGIPEYLRIVAKPIVDIILSGGDATATPRETILKAGGGLLLRDVTYIESELDKCRCSGGGQGEPYASLTAGEPADQRHVSRYNLLDAGHGHTLFEIAQIQKKIGACTCEGRKSANVTQHHA
eukprot:m.130318 g.130318  ORF g.130318 m.130318 type:complete len:237 (+) comp13709_c0_seq2:971-1681(+)